MKKLLLILLLTIGCNNQEIYVPLVGNEIYWYDNYDNRYTEKVIGIDFLNKVIFCEDGTRIENPSLNLER